LERLQGIETAEIVVAAAGDTKATEDAVAGRAAILWPPHSTRSALMNVGAAAAGGNVFLFLHADSFPPPNALGEIQTVLRDNTILGGAFEHRFAERVWSLRLISWLNRRRYFMTRNYYGDQGIFVRARCARLDLHNLQLVNATEQLANRSPLEMRVARMLSPYRDYLQQDVQFDDSTARRLLGRHRVEPPVIDDRELERFLELAWFSEQNGPPAGSPWISNSNGNTNKSFGARVLGNILSSRAFHRPGSLFNLR
jgi:hypothetical protein